MKIIKGSGQSADDGKLTYHGSAPRREILKFGGQSGRWKVEARRLGSARGINGDGQRPRGRNRGA